MATQRTSSILPTITMEQVSGKQHAKRKVVDDDDSTLGPSKRRKETSGKSSKPKGKMQVLPGGLNVIRGLPPALNTQHFPAPPQTISVPQPPASPPIRPAPPLVAAQLNAIAGPSQRKNAPRPASHKLRIGSQSAEPEVDDEARRMQLEYGELKGKQRADLQASGGPSRRFKPLSAFLPPHTANHTSGPITPTPARGLVDSLQPMPMRETPLIKKNKAMRENTRRSSFGQRGKRASESLGNGVISQPHASVPTSNFHKHITSDLPEAHRLRHLLVWLGSRAITSPVTLPSAVPPLPHLTAAGSKLKRAVQDELVSMLVEAKIDTRISGVSQPPPSDGKFMNEHEQNIKNRKREDDFIRGIELCKVEDAAWHQVRVAYNAIQSQSSAAINLRMSKGKQRASSGGPDGVELSTLDDTWRNGLEEMQAERELGRFSPGLERRIQHVELQVDELHQAVHRSSTFTDQATLVLDHLFKTLAWRVPSKSTSAVPGQTLLPPRTKADKDPMDVMRALSRTDLVRPQSTAPILPGGSNIQGHGVTEKRAERRVTAVGLTVPTPRRAPGTPRRLGSNTGAGAGAGTARKGGHG